MSNQQLINSISKSQRKAFTKQNQNSSKYEKCRAMRPLILKILRRYDEMEADIEWSIFLQMVYKKISENFIPNLTQIIDEHPSGYPGYDSEIKYLQKFQKNLLDLKKRAENSTIQYYNFLPGYKIPLDIRNHIIGFISPLYM